MTTPTDRRHTDREIESLREEIAALRTDVESLLEAWRTATGMLSAIKWLAGIGGAIGAIWVAAKTR